MTTCRKCYVELIEGQNCYSLKRKDYICKSCRPTPSQVWRYKGQGVYAIYDNGECLYVGESSQLNNRISQHKTWVKNPLSTKKSIQYLYNNLSQHKHIIFGVLEETPNHKEREQYWINKLKPKYNAKI